MSDEDHTPTPGIDAEERLTEGRDTGCSRWPQGGSLGNQLFRTRWVNRFEKIKGHTGRQLFVHRALDQRLQNRAALRRIHCTQCTKEFLLLPECTLAEYGICNSLKVLHGHLDVIQQAQRGCPHRSIAIFHGAADGILQSAEPELMQCL